MPKFFHLNFKSKFRDLIRTVFPESFAELAVFLISLFGYGILAFFIAQNYRIIFDNRIAWDAYFSFDNRSIITTGGGFERHPLSKYFFDILRKLALAISGNQYNADFRTVLAFSSVVAVSFANLHIFKYLKNIIGLPLFWSFLLVFFWGLFVTPVLLSFTPETYTYSLMLLVLFNYYAALKLRKDEKISGVALALAATTTGGLTITNFVKVYIPVLFENILLRSWKNFGNAAQRIILSFAVFAFLVLLRVDFNYSRLFNKAGEQLEKFSQAKKVPVWDMIYSWFFGGNMLFSSFEIRQYHNFQKTFYFKALFMETYSSVFQYGAVALVLILVFWSWFRNFRNPLVNILMISFLVDIFIHCVLKFGLHTSYIYGGHFIYVVAMMLGWLIFSYRNFPKMQSFLLCILSVLLIYFGMNNFFRMTEFFEFLNLYYR